MSTTTATDREQRLVARAAAGIAAAAYCAPDETDTATVST